MSILTSYPEFFSSPCRLHVLTQIGRVLDHFSSHLSKLLLRIPLDKGVRELHEVEHSQCVLQMPYISLHIDIDQLAVSMCITAVHLVSNCTGLCLCL